MAAEPTRSPKGEVAMERTAEQSSPDESKDKAHATGKSSGYAGLVAALARQRRDSQDCRDAEDRG